MTSRALLAALLLGVLAACEGNTRFDLRLRAKPPRATVAGGVAQASAPCVCQPSAGSTGRVGG